VIFRLLDPRPSAGERTAPPAPAGTERSGSRKNASEAAAAAAKGSARRRRPMRASTAATPAGSAMNGQPSRATGSFGIIVTRAEA
jgi:hypothetical protein